MQNYFLAIYRFCTTDVYGVCNAVSTIVLVTGFTEITTGLFMALRSSVSLG
jgi:hypothetical protein